MVRRPGRGRAARREAPAAGRGRIADARRAGVAAGRPGQRPHRPRRVRRRPAPHRRSPGAAWWSRWRRGRPASAADGRWAPTRGPVRPTWSWPPSSPSSPTAKPGPWPGSSGSSGARWSPRTGITAWPAASGPWSWTTATSCRSATGGSRVAGPPTRRAGGSRPGCSPARGPGLVRRPGGGRAGHRRRAGPGAGVRRPGPPGELVPSGRPGWLAGTALLAVAAAQPQTRSSADGSPRPSVATANDRNPIARPNWGE
jgi:hypothetical protein